MRPLVRCVSLTAYLQEHVFAPGRLGTDTPVLVFASRPGTAGSTKQLSPPQPLTLDSNLDKCNLFHKKSIDLRVATFASSFPTRQDVRKAQQLIDETGARTILGVGSGAAMDLVKSIDLGRAKYQPGDQKVLIPATSAAIMAAHTPHALILDEETQLLWTQPCSSANISTVSEPGAIAASPHTAPACHTLLMDACYRAPERLLDVELARMALASDPILEGPLTTSFHIESGQTKTIIGTTQANAHTKMIVRSAPLVLAAALLPTVFPEASIFSFWAALLPGMASLFDKTIHRDQFPCLEDLSTGRGALSTEFLLRNLQLHQQLTMGSGGPVQDVEMETLEQILRVSLNRD